MKLNLKSLCLMLLFSLITFFAFSQKKMNAECGSKIESEFTNNREDQDIQIQLNAGDMIEVTIVPIGSYLKVRADLLDSKGNKIIDGKTGMIGTNKKNEILKSEVLSSNGLYSVRIYNFWNDSYLGVYTASITCIKRNGEVIKPD